MLTLTTVTFTLCFAVWMLNGVLVTYLVEHGIFEWSYGQVGWLIGAPVLTGAVMRLPAGILTDKYGGKPIMIGVLLLCALLLAVLPFATGFWTFLLCSLGFGIAGASFAVGIAYTSLWYPKNWQGTALGIFGAGNAGAAITTLVAPTLLQIFTNDGANLDGWRMLPWLYAGIMASMAVIFFLLARHKKSTDGEKTLREFLEPLKNVIVWRFGLYYFLVFGCFVAFAQWLVPYFVNSYYLPLATAGFLASAFSFPSGVIRALGGWMSDIFGARKVMYWVLGASVIISLFLIFPRMIIQTPGQGVMAEMSGTVVSVSNEEIVVDNTSYPLVSQREDFDLSQVDEQVLIWPTKVSWNEPVVEPGDEVHKQQLLAKGKTQIYFQANVWIAATLIIIIGIVWGIGKAAVYKYIPDYFPNQVGVVGGMVGVLGGLGGFVCPIIFGYLLEWTGIWTSSWIFMFALSILCLWWFHRIISKMMHEKYPEEMRQIEVLD